MALAKAVMLPQSKVDSAPDSICSPQTYWRILCVVQGKQWDLPAEA